MALIIDAMTGTVLDMGDCYLVEDSNLTDEEEAMLDSGSDSLIGELARRAGIPLDGFALETLKYHRLTSVSYGPSALRDEAEVLLEVIPETDDPEDIALHEGLKWMLTEATDDELSWLGQHILNDDSVWNGFRENVLDALRWRAEGNEPF